MKLGLVFATLCITSVAAASPTHGTLVAIRELDPNQGVLYDADLRGGEGTWIEVTGDNSGGDLDCILYNKQSDIIAEDKDHKVDACHLAVNIKTTGTYRLLVINHGTSRDKLTMILQ